MICNEIIPHHNKTNRGKAPASFLKWAGSKRSVMPQLLTRLPVLSGRYFEPMMGSATLFFTLTPPIAYLSDINEELVHCFKMVQNRVEDIIQGLSQLENTSSCYQEIRAIEPNAHDELFRAIRTIYLNKTCFNGLYRLNKKGLFNAPYGNIQHANVCDAQTLRRTSLALQQAHIRHQSFEYVLHEAVAGDFVYFDPPYLESESGKKSKFRAYTAQAFTSEQHAHLANIVHELTKKNVKIMLSNADNTEVRELYNAYRIDVLQTRRPINRNLHERHGWTELLIRNY